MAPAKLRETSEGLSRGRLLHLAHRVTYEMKDEIIEKIRGVLDRPFTQEMQVVYLLVEVRKLILREKYQDGLLMTFCNWAVHEELTLPRPGPTLVLKELEELVARAEEGKEPSKPLEQVSGAGFRESLTRFFATFDLPQELTNNADDWRRFTNLYSSVVTECPISYTASRQELKYVQKADLQRIQGAALAWRITLKDGRVRNQIILLG